MVDDHYTQLINQSVALVQVLHPSSSSSYSSAVVAMVDDPYLQSSIPGLPI